MFARLRKLPFFKAVESCTGGYGRFRCQRVKESSLGPHEYWSVTTSFDYKANLVWLPNSNLTAIAAAIVGSRRVFPTVVARF